MQAVSTRIRLRVAPGSARTGIVGPYGDGWKVRVGKGARDKVVTVDGLDEKEIERRLIAAAESVRP
jgi:uncharacterized protein YggU (UPF0235/DUF167 family)